ncbi:MAG: hypothetical protein LBC99_10725 [Spirochaetota bacterium]|nr:hypothetical protein [Spirochaetota bacterium]
MVRRIFFTIYMCVFALRLFAEYPTLEAPSLSVQVDLLQRTYYINEPIPVYMTVVNTSAEPVRFSLAQQIFLNFDFRVRSLQDMQVKERDDWQLHKLASRQDILQAEAARSITLAPGERFGRVIDIAEWLRLIDPGVYELTGYFWMYPQRASYDYRYESNRKRFLLEAPREVVEAIALEKATQSETEVKRMSADETVDYIISAKRRGDWDAYFRFMDLTRLINVFHQYRARYVAADLASRSSVMDDFKNFLRAFPSEQIDHHFVQNVTVTRDEATLNESAKVECMIVYRTGQLVERKIYHFSLYRKLDRWYVDSYYVINK